MNKFKRAPNHDFQFSDPKEHHQRRAELEARFTDLDGALPLPSSVGLKHLNDLIAARPGLTVLPVVRKSAGDKLDNLADAKEELMDALREMDVKVLEPCFCYIGPGWLADTEALRIAAERARAANAVLVFMYPCRVLRSVRYRTTRRVRPSGQEWSFFFDIIGGLEVATVEDPDMTLQECHRRHILRGLRAKAKRDAESPAKLLPGWTVRRRNALLEHVLFLKYVDGVSLRKIEIIVDVPFSTVRGWTTRFKHCADF